MHNDISNEDTIIEHSLYRLINFLEERVSWQHPTKYYIAECFANDNPNCDPKVYELSNLTIVIEDGIVICNDADGILEENMYNNSPLPLQSFTVDSIAYIGFQTDNTITISFNNGYIKIIY